MQLWGGIRSWWRCLALLGALTLFFSVLRNPGAVRTYFYSAFREGSRIVLDIQNQHLQVLEGDHFRIKYQAADSNVANLVLETAEGIFKSVNQSLGYIPDQKVPVVIYPTGDALARCFGWPADEGALGVYWIGTIRILSPNVWATAKGGGVDPKAFKDSGPMAHEYTHYVIDYLTGGNYTRWFTEGVAQKEEKRITGFVFSNPFIDSNGHKKEYAGKKLRAATAQEVEAQIYSELYSLTEMDSHFDYLPNQMQAYWESFMAIEYICEEFGPERVNLIIGDLSKGYSLNQSLERSLGVNLLSFDHDFKQWAAHQAAINLVKSHAYQANA